MSASDSNPAPASPSPPGFASAAGPGAIPAPPVLPPFRPPAVAQGTSPGQYEFGHTENLILRNLGSKMGFVGLFMLGSGLFFFGSMIVRWFRNDDLDVFGLLFVSLLFAVVGIWTHRAGREFRSVADTQGKDVSHLMGALENLLKFYTLLYVLFFIVLVFAIIQLGAHSLYGILPGDPPAQTQSAAAQPDPAPR